MARTCRRIALTALLVLFAAPLGAQQRAERFPEATTLEMPAPAALVADRSSYWVEGAIAGGVAGVVIGVVTIEPSGACPLEPGADCYDDYSPVVLGSLLLGIAGAAVGAILGASVARAGYGN